LNSALEGAAWRRAAQAALLRLFAAAAKTGLLQSRLGQWAFERSYDVYKEIIEARLIDRLRSFVPPGTTVIDVGANIGFFTRRFARWVGPDGKVIAIEPEPVNFAGLIRRLKASGLDERVDAVRAAACEKTGTVRLALNPDHPGDHRLGEQGIAVAGVALDDIAAERGWPKISLIKIDVQGAEQRVLAGARKVILRCRPALYVEISESDLRRHGANAAELLAGLDALDYGAHRLTRGGVSPPLDRDALARFGMLDESYVDLLFLPRS